MSGTNESIHVLLGLTEWCLSKNVKELSIFAWSTENWTRPQREIKYAMTQLQQQLQRWIDTPDHRFSFTFVSSTIQQIPLPILQQMKTLQTATDNDSLLRIYIYISYGFKEGCIAEPRYKQDPDLLVRTSGEQRLSNFCMGNLTYTELLFIEPLFPECTAETWDMCMAEFTSRHRRHGN